MLLMSFYTPRIQTRLEAEELPSTVSASTDTYLPYGPNTSESASLSVTLLTSDARPKVIDNFFKKYNSPMQGLGETIVQASDRNGIPFGYLPAISGCESTFGKVLPQESYNAWGYGIYGGGVLRFKDWAEGIDRVTMGLKDNYFSKGLDTPEAIMHKYTPQSSGSWADCISQFLEELT